MTEDKEKRKLSDAAATIINGVLTFVGGIIVALITIGFFPFLNPDMEEPQTPDAELQAQLFQMIPAPKDSATWIDQNGGKHRYWVCQGFLNGAKTLDWEKAEAFCEHFGGHLATITSRGEQVYIEEYVQKNGPKAKNAYHAAKVCLWIGIQANNGNWNQWITGESFDYTNWNEWYPTRSGDEWDRRDSNNYSVFSNGEFPQSVTHNGELIASHHVKIGEWLLISANEISDYNPDGWLICEWDYD